MNTEKKKFSLKSFLIDNSIYVIFIVIMVAITVVDPNFIAWKPFRNILYQSSNRIIMALGVMFIIISGSSDLSGGRIMGFSSVLAGSLLQIPSYPTKMHSWLVLTDKFIWVAFLICIAFGILFGVLNGVIVSVLRVPAFIGTLGMQLFVYGFTFLHYNMEPNNGQPIGTFIEGFKKLGQGSFFDPVVGIPHILVIAVIMLIICHIVMTYTRFGKNLYAMGGNLEAARVSGIKTVKTQILVYAVAGFFYAMAGFMEASRNNSANASTTGQGAEFDAIASCVVGGVSIAGGVGAVPGVFIGVLIYNLISYGLNFIGVDPNWQYVVKGGLLVVAVGIDVQKYVRRR